MMIFGPPALTAPARSLRGVVPPHDATTPLVRASTIENFIAVEEKHPTLKLALHEMFCAALPFLYFE